MVCKPINLINAKSEEIYDYAMFWFNTTIQATVFDAIYFCYRISQPWLTSGDIPYPEQFHQMTYIEQIAIWSEQNAITQNLSEHMLRQ